MRSALTSSCPNSGVEGAGLDQRPDAPGGGRGDDAAVERQGADAVDDREGAGLLDVDLVRADADRRHEGAEHAEGGRVEGLDQVGEAREQRLLAAHGLDQRRLGLAQEVRPAGDRDGVEEDAEVHRRVGAPLQHPDAELPDQPVQRLRPDGVADHDVARAGRKAEAVERAGEGLAEAVELRRRHRLRQQEPVVLVGAHRLLAPPLAAHQQEAALLLDRGRRQQVEQLEEQAPVEVGGDLGDLLHLHALAVQPLHLGLDVARRGGELVHAAGAVDAAGDELGVAGDQAEDVDVLQEAGPLAVPPHRDPALVVLGHQQQRLEHEVLGVHRNDVEMADVPHRRLERHPPQHRRLGEVHAGDHARCARRLGRRARCRRSPPCGGRPAPWWHRRR